MRKPFIETYVSEGELLNIKKEWLTPDHLANLVNVPDYEITETYFKTFVSFFVQYGLPIYKIGNLFGTELLKTDLDIVGKYVPANKYLCIEFPDNIRFKLSDNIYLHNAFVVTLPFTDTKQNNFTRICIYLPYYTETGEYIESGSRLTLDLDENEIISEHLVTIYDAENQTKRLLNPDQGHTLYDYVQYVIKCLIYINSGSPDLRDYRAPKCATKNPKKIRRWMNQHENDSLIDMIYVGFDFKKPRVYQEGEKWIETFPRWQPYGTGRSQVKLIWVTPHTRKYGSKSG